MAARDTDEDVLACMMGSVIGHSLTGRGRVQEINDRGHDWASDRWPCSQYRAHTVCVIISSFDENDDQNDRPPQKKDDDAVIKKPSMNCNAEAGVTQTAKVHPVEVKARP